MMIDHDFTSVMVDLFLTKLLKHFRSTREDRLDVLDTILPMMDGSIPPILIKFIDRLRKDSSQKVDRLLDHLLETTDDQAMKQFIINLTVNGYVHGSKIIRENELKFGFLIPPLITYDFNREEPFYLYKNNMERLISESEAVGIYTHRLILQHPRFSLHQAIELASQHPKSAFFIFVDPKHVTSTIIEPLKKINNTVLFLHLEPESTFEQSLSLLRQTRKLIGGFMRVEHQTLENYLTESHLRRLSKSKIPVQFLLPSQNHVLDHKLIERVNRTSYHPVITVEERSLIHDVSRSIFGTVRDLCIYSSGRTRSLHGTSAQITNTTLLSVLKQTMPKK